MRSGEVKRARASSTIRRPSSRLSLRRMESGISGQPFGEVGDAGLVGPEVQALKEHAHVPHKAHLVESIRLLVLEEALPEVELVQIPHSIVARPLNRREE